MRTALPLVLFAVLPLSVPATGQQVERLLVCNKGAASLSIFDPATRTELAVVPTGDGPHEVAVAPDGRTAVVTDYGSQTPGTTLTVVDVLRGERVRTIELGLDERDAAGEPRRKAFPRPHGIAFVAADRVVVTSESARRLIEVDVTAGRVLRTWTTPQRTMHMVALAPDRGRAFATSVHDGDVACLDLRAEPPAAPVVIACGDGAEGLAVDPVRGFCWVGNRAAHTLSIVDPATATVVALLPTDDLPFRVAFTPDGARALVSCADAGTVQVFDAAERRLERTIAVAGDTSEASPLPMGICVDAAGERAYVACGRGEYVAVLRLADGARLDRLATRAGPDGIAIVRVAEPARDASVIR